MPAKTASPAQRAEALKRVEAHVAKHGQRGALTAVSRSVGVPVPTLRSWVLKDPPTGYHVRAGAGRKWRAAGAASETKALRALLRIAKRLTTARARVVALEAEYAARRARL